MDTIEIRGARTHNLKNIDLDIPRDKLVLITGLSGSGKSSLAFDTLYAEGQRRYVESLSSYARQFLSLMEKPDIDQINGLSPAISIEQKSTSHNPRSTVGTITEIYDYLRLLYARIGIPKCPIHKYPLIAKTISQIVDEILALEENTKLILLAPVIKNRKGEYIKLLDEIYKKGFLRARIDGEIINLENPPKLSPKQKHTIEVVVDRFKVKSGIELRLAESIETALELTTGIIKVIDFENQNKIDLLFSTNYSCPECGYALSELEPRIFSFNNPAGACHKCSGLGVQEYFDPINIVNYDLSIKKGAIKGWEPKNLFYYQRLESIASFYEFDLDTPFKDLSKKYQDILLYGSNDEISFSIKTKSGSLIRKKDNFEGIINNFDRRYKETDSQSSREELSKLLSTKVCSECSGSRLKEESRNVFINDINLPEIVEKNIFDSFNFFKSLELDTQQKNIATKILNEIQERLNFLVNVGLSYLTLSRSAETLSGGEAQRIRLASQIGAGLMGVMYVLDEPSIGLHQRDNEKLINTLTYLRDLGNTVIVVEHDEDAIMAADYIIDIGPGAGVHGGEVTAKGSLQDILNNENSLTGKFLSGIEKIEIPKNRIPYNKEKILTLSGAKGNNLKNVNLNIPLGLFTAITGVSGSGKSTLINRTLFPIAQNILNKANNTNISPYSKVQGFEQLDKVINIDQSPIGRTPRSNPATYTGLFTPIRDLFANTKESKTRGYKAGRFSFNVKGGRCEACQGDGLIKVEMHFMPDVYITCEQCQGKRYNRETLEIKYREKSIHDILSMTVEEAFNFFENIPAIKRKLTALKDVGLSYITLGQFSTTLSGGEAQRIKLATELSKNSTGKTLYILDEPTTGLHFADVKQLLGVLHSLRDQGNTIVVIEHNLDVIKTADWIVDLGPEGGNGGGEIVAAGTPEKVSKVKGSYTGLFLKKILSKK